MNKVMFATIIGILGCSPLISCANTAPDKSKHAIIYINDESRTLTGKKLILFRNNQTEGTASSVANTVISNVQPNPDIEIKITYKVESSFANEVATQINNKVSNQIYIEKCCKLDSARINLRESQINISYYK